MATAEIKVFLVDDHPTVLSGLEHVLNGQSTIRVVGKASSATALWELLTSQSCDVLVSDYSMPGCESGDGAAMFERLRRLYPELGIVVLTMMDNALVVRSLRSLGIHCILSKSDAVDHLLPAVYGAMAKTAYFSPAVERLLEVDHLAQPADKRALTAREAEVVRLFVAGLTVNDIAAKLKRSKQTISTQKASAMRKLGAERDADLLLLYKS
ncbi:response regulator [Chromobacterium haemolyticum]|uniref:response regulator n=1 Tax=Chromobacterium haemolyticum TaxID=394935 RepID=UPI001317DAEB|nr:response regulator [Chromobacterium haemolyticum]BBH12312.1 DNA-binding response regulator [Chromobacterium haemolyticum]